MQLQSEQQNFLSARRRKSTCSAGRLLAMPPPSSRVILAAASPETRATVHVALDLQIQTHVSTCVVLLKQNLYAAKITRREGIRRRERALAHVHLHWQLTLACGSNERRLMHLLHLSHHRRARTHARSHAASMRARNSANTRKRAQTRARAHARAHTS